MRKEAERHVVICYDEKNKSTHQKQENEHALPGSIIAVGNEVSTAFGHLSKPQVWGLVLWSAGIALSGAAGITQISALLALVLDTNRNKRCFNAYASGIWMRNTKAGKSGESWM